MPRSSGLPRRFKAFAQSGQTAGGIAVSARRASGSAERVVSISSPFLNRWSVFRQSSLFYERERRLEARGFEPLTSSLQSWRSTN
jgi:hypothetical protein